MPRRPYVEWTTPEDAADASPFADRAVRERMAALIAAAARTEPPRAAIAAFAPPCEPPRHDPETGAFGCDPVPEASRN